MTFRDGASLNLLFDADDTLWDSNVHFLEAFEAFARALESVGANVGRDGAHAAVRAVELELIQTHGYGRRPYVIALQRAGAEIAPAEHRDTVRVTIERIGEHLAGRQCELLPGVAETVPELASRHHLILFTKGQRDEQLLKLKRSGLAPYFSRVETPREKDLDAYRRVLAEYALDPSRTFMIGNSPRSDINPAVRAGLRAAVYIPYAHTWELENEEIDRSSGRVIELPSFHAVRQLF